MAQEPENSPSVSGTQVNIKSRIIFKHDTEANWKLAKNFIPKAGELIIYDKDSSHSYDRFKIGDGKTKVNDLSFGITPDPLTVSDAHTTDEYITAANASGEYHKWKISEDFFTERVIVSRTATGNIQVPDTPMGDNSATSRKYVDNLAASSRHEAYLEWGGRDLTGTFSPLDAALNDDLRGNRLAGLPNSCYKFERSADAGATWTTFNYNGGNLGTTQGGFDNGNSKTNKSASNWHRITIQVDGYIYCILTKIAIYLSTNGATGCKCKVEFGDYSNTTVWTNNKTVSVSGWSGWNIINSNATIGSATYGKIKYIRLTFSQTGVATANEPCNLSVIKLRLFSSTCWAAPSMLANTGHLYSWNDNLDVTFPGNVSAKNITTLTSDVEKVKALDTLLGNQTIFIVKEG